VSREWRALISDPGFIATHRTRGEPLIAANSFSQTSTLRLKVINTKDAIFIFACASPHNLICVVAYSFLHVTVINLATGEIIETGIKGSFIGFGRAAQSGVYKIVTISPRSSRVCSVGGMKWNVMEPFHTQDQFTCSVGNFGRMERFQETEYPL
jgi:hypothetical protein